MISRSAERFWSTSLAVLVVCATLLQPRVTPAQTVAVRHTEGVVHGFLALRTLKGEPEILADGDLIQVARGNRVTTQWCSTSRMVRSTTKPPFSPRIISFGS